MSDGSSKVLETDRLILRRLSFDDGAFILQLLNDPAWLRFIGDKGVRNLEDARNYIVTGPMDMYARLGFGLYLTERKSDGAPIGICGLIKRDALEDVDIGFAFLPAFRGKGYAREAAAAVMEHARSAFGLRRLVAITSPDNEASIRLLEKLGLRFEASMSLADDSHEVSLFAADLPDRAAS
jgi:[ribosomal protein S5]-alanine N-acetyltransferase